ncbi:MAG: TlpA disulfide reductase family protein [Bacteroidota bacterium]
MMLLQILTGLWRAVLLLPDAELPFNFEMKKEENAYVMIIHNDEERIKADEIVIKGDSLYIKLPVYDSQFRLKVNGNTMEGDWINYSRKEHPVIPFKATFKNVNRFIPANAPTLDVNGRWETWMDVTETDSSLAIGVFRQEGNEVGGTFLASGGDHRYLEGTISGDTLWMSTFDGSHCWLYRAVKNGTQLSGTFWSGNHYKSSWHASRNATIQLPDPESVAAVTMPLTFSFPDADSNFVSLTDERFKGKAIIVQVMGSWCPNCLDETAFLSDFYIKNKDKGIEIVALDFEKTTDFARISNNIKRLSARFKTTYPILYAGSVGREEVMKKIPGLENFKSYPTTIYINRQGKVIEVYSGFSGPATGVEYEKFILKFEKTIAELLK